MTLTQLRYFIAVARNKSLSKAATELNIAQPSITRQLSLLEDELATVLLLRHNRGVALTDAGQLFLERAEFQIRGFDQMRTEFRDQSAALQGHLRVGCPPSLTKQFLLKPLEALLTSHPSLSLEFRETISEELARSVLSDNLDLAVVSAIATQPHIISEPLFREQIWLYGPANEKLPKSVDIKFLAKIPLLLARRNNPTRELIEREASNKGLKLNILVETDSTPLIDHLVQHRHGYRAAPFFANYDRHKARELSAAPIKGLTIERCVIRRKDRPLTRPMSEFLVLVRQQFKRFKGEGTVG